MGVVIFSSPLEAAWVVSCQDVLFKRISIFCGETRSVSVSSILRSLASRALSSLMTLISLPACMFVHFYIWT